MTGSMQEFNFAVVDYPGSSKASIYGFLELFETANRAAIEVGVGKRFCTEMINGESTHTHKEYSVVLLPPSGEEQYYLAPNQQLMA